MDATQLLPSLKAMPVFKGLPDTALTRILTAGIREEAGPGAVLMRCQELADCFYLVIEGRVEIRAPEGTPIATLDDGQVVGEMGLFAEDRKRNADVIVVRPAVMIKVNYERLHRLFEKDAKVAAIFKSNLRDLAQARGKRAPTGKLAPPAAETPEMPGVPEVAAQPVEFTPLVPIQIKMALALCQLFEHFGGEDLEALLAVGQPVRLSQYQFLMREGDPADRMFVIALGRLGIIAKGGAPHQLIAQVAAGACVGEMPLALPIKRRVCSVVALTQVSLIQLLYTDILALMELHPAMRARFTANLKAVIAGRL